uniref:NUDIX hydrolase n=1 Tax=Pithovirus LCPAC102 TaxID=2506587 RepID=A0A481Z2W0_9VIRU|nr:MAG: NUDIX hydrolase [Pithovirus LCPAC102]
MDKHSCISNKYYIQPLLEDITTSYIKISKSKSAYIQEIIDTAENIYYFINRDSHILLSEYDFQHLPSHTLYSSKSSTICKNIYTKNNTIYNISDTSNSHKIYPNTYYNPNDTKINYDIKKSPRKYGKKRTRSGNTISNKYIMLDTTPVHISNLSDFPDNLNNLDSNEQSSFNRIERSGVIIYTKIKDSNGNDQIMYALGVDSIYNEYGDFSGGVGKRDKTVIKGGLRELKEESMGVFGNITSEELDNFLSLYTNKSMIMFIHINVDPDKINNIFNDRIKYSNNPEMNEIIWVNNNEFISLIHGQSVHDKFMFSKVQNICYRAYTQEDFTKLL